jgi:isopentenyldiphosphate isomerase
MAEDAHEELLNVYDAEGRVVGARPRAVAKASGLAVGAVNALVFDGRSRVLLQRRPADKENGGRWDKSVGGHVAAGESFDETMRRETGEELFDDPASPQVHLLDGEDAYRAALRGDLRRTVVLRRVSLQLNLRDVRIAPGGGGVRNVVYHVAVYAGRTEVPREGFRPQPSEIEELRYCDAHEVDRLLLDGALAPNMAFLWLTHAHRLLGEAP